MPTTDGGTQVLFNGIAAPIIYASSTQVSAMVPYEVGALPNPWVEVKYGGQTSDAYPIAPANTAPGLFTFNSSGRGPGAILDEDGSVNAPSNPAKKGSIVVLYSTGEGQTLPSGVTGRVSTVSAGQLMPAPVEPVSVLIDGQAAEVLFAGEAPGTVSGIMQVNVRVPPDARTGDLDIVLNVGANSSQSGVTISVQ